MYIGVFKAICRNALKQTPKMHETYYSIIGTEGKSMDLFEIGRSVSV